MIVAVDGQIGSGKSTFLSFLKQNLDEKEYVIVQEDVNNWLNLKNDAGASIFELFYSDKTRYAYIFQSFVLMSRFNNLVQTQRLYPEKTIICERSFLTDIEIFAKTLFEQGHFTDIEWSVYAKWHKSVQDIASVNIDASVYIRASPEVCLQRIQKRHRCAEDQIDMTYLSSLHKKHEEWLMDPERNTRPMLVIDGNHPEDETYTKEMLSLFKDFVDKTKNNDREHSSNKLAQDVFIWHI